ncbi:MAG: hypothetical protein BGO67_03205 [Alphaproteobacteria bacterium 41-28]|nr:MAG: hypothetical protein BGO67_03205 [Alphaproteobacteria bacterium 41-28]
MNKEDSHSSRKNPPSPTLSEERNDTPQKNTKSETLIPHNDEKNLYEKDYSYQQEGAQVNLHSMTQNNDKEKPETSAETPLEPAAILNSNGQTMRKMSSENGPKVSFPNLTGTTEDEPDL